jgi:hypothetical protein
LGPARFELLFSKRGGNTAFHRWAAKHFSKYDSFEAFVKGWLNSENIYEHTHFFPQHMFLYDETGSLAVDFLGRFEKLEKDFRHVRERLDGLGSDLQQLNTSSAAITELATTTRCGRLLLRYTVRI